MTSHWPALAIAAGLTAGICASSWAQIPANLRIRGDKAFKKQAVEAIKKLEQTKTGAEVLSRIAKTGKRISVRRGKLEQSGAMMLTLGGGDSIIIWDPGFELRDFPAFLVLHHELVHALFEAQGRGLPSKREEARALGIGQFADSKISENALRRELGLPERSNYWTHKSWTHSRQHTQNH